MCGEHRHSCTLSSVCVQLCKYVYLCSLCLSIYARHLKQYEHNTGVLLLNRLDVFCVYFRYYITSTNIRMNKMSSSMIEYHILRVLSLLYLLYQYSNEYHIHYYLCWIYYVCYKYMCITNITCNELIIITNIYL